MRRIPLNTLAAFRSVAELQNLRAAAEVLNLTHSAVSQQIKGLEERIGFDVFERRGRRVVLNPAGQVLLRSVQGALAQLDDGVQAAAAIASGEAQRLRITTLPSFAQRWLLPRLNRWRELHPSLPLEIDASFTVVDLQRDGFHAAIRQGAGPWPNLASERLMDQPPIIMVAAPATARRLRGAPVEVLLREPLLGDADMWEAWAAAAGHRVSLRTMAVFNDAGLMLQATEQELGLSLSREILAADALVGGSLVQVSPIAITHADARPYHFVFPPSLREWPPLVSLLDWLREELAMSSRALRELRMTDAPVPVPAPRTPRSRGAARKR